ncbi:glutamate mutase L [Pseudonocardia sp. C8]|uniref:glutamate mutase L n=1 Tax=Pseudonocardia sp. C8 TaxID=2762759 RepID=UPI0016434A79|nr:glutamate mutase L [Pseudonocardia sp. C8]MBC3193767.1 glutamate mutase L [Pseudonocardia sp. C8]
MTDPRSAGPGTPDSAAVCLDVGSSWTKAVLIRPDGTPEGFAEHPTTADVLEGIDAAVAAAVASVGRRAGGLAPDVLACSSAGGPLRLAVVGAERLTSTEAGHRVCHSAGARVVGVHAGPLESDGARELAGQRPGAVLLLGGSAGDDPGVLLHNARRLARIRGRWPVLLAVADDLRDDALGLLRAGGRAVTTCPDLVPRPGEIVPGPVRDAVADLYARQVLGMRPGPGRFAALAPTRTPAAVAAGAEALARLTGSRVVVVDVGSATTDVHLATPSGGPAVMTVEGDLGVRDGAGGVLVEGQTEGIMDPVEADLLGPAVAALEGSGPAVPADRGAAAEDRRLAAVAAVVALRRHLRYTGRLDAGVPVGAVATEPGAAPPPDAHGEIGLVVLTGGVFRQRDPAGLAAVAGTVRHDPVLLPALAQVEVRVDSESVLAPAGLLAAHGRHGAARSLLAERLPG